MEKSDNLSVVEAKYAFSGPIPPPEAMERYERVVPGAADRIISMAETEQKHRHAYEEKEQSNSYRVICVTVIFAFMALIIVCGIVVFAIIRGMEGTAIATILGAVASIVGLFIYRRAKSKN